MKVRTNRIVIVTWCCWLGVAGGALFLRERTAYKPIIRVQSLSQIIPTEFADWQATPDASMSIVNPQLRESVSKVYDETMNRIYISRNNGHIVMLSIAYGRDQSHDKQVHKPEVCYPSQGFQISKIRTAKFTVAGRAIPVTTLLATKGTRSEYVAYWMVEGDSIVRGALQQNFKRTSLALQGIREDGLLFRVSEISTDENASIELLREFAGSLVESIDPRLQRSFVGSTTFPLAGFPR
jgi:EpsI family protein